MTRLEERVELSLALVELRAAQAEHAPLLRSEEPDVARAAGAGLSLAVWSALRRLEVIVAARGGEP